MFTLSNIYLAIIYFFISISICLFLFLIFYVLKIGVKFFKFIFDTIFKQANSKTYSNKKKIYVPRLSKAEIKGQYGEFMVLNTLTQLPNDNYRIINNVMFRTEKGTTQIDHIIVSFYGIFVIETKNYKGLITGQEFDDKWTQHFYKHKTQFYNPTKQNYGHIKTLEKILELPNSLFISLVVFSDQAKLNVHTNTSVISVRELLPTILSYQVHKIAPLDVERITTSILNANIMSNETNHEHISNVQRNLYEQNQKIQNNICPRCGGQLVPRSSKYGKFVGCSNFPKCRYKT